MSESRILVLDADVGRSERIATLLDFMDFSPRVVADVSWVELASSRAGDWVAIVLGDVGNGVAWERFVRWLALQPLCPPILELPGHASDAAWRAGAPADGVWQFDYPVRRSQLQDALRRASLQRLDRDARNTPSSGPMGSSGAALQLNRMIDQVAPYDTTVLITGERGAGKEVAARALHARSPRRDRPFVVVACGAIEPDAFELELFGHEKGAFTGAVGLRKGQIESAEGGMILLDDIGDMPREVQAKLLRVLQERRFVRVGGVKPIDCDVRIVAATHRNLEEGIALGEFNEALFYRLNVFPIGVPALRERIEDLPSLVDDILGHLVRAGRGHVSLSDDAIAALRHYGWPGNVRELANLLERLTVLHPGATVCAADLPARYHAAKASLAQLTVPPSMVVQAPAVRSMAPHTMPANITLPPAGIDLRRFLAGIEQELLCAALAQAGGIVAHAASLLGLRRTTLVEKMRRHGIGRTLLGNGDMRTSSRP